MAFSAADPDELWSVLRRSLVLVQLGLVLGCLAVPLLAVGTGVDSDDPATPYRLYGGLVLYVSDGGPSFDLDTHPNGVPFGLALTKAGLVLLVAGLAVAVGAALSMLHEAARRIDVILGRVAAGALLAGAIALALGQDALDESDIGTALQPGLLLPVGAAVWLLSLCSALVRWAAVSAAVDTRTGS